MGAATQLLSMFMNLIGGSAPSGAASATGDIGQMVKYNVAQTQKIDGAATAGSPTAGSLAAVLATVNSNTGSLKGQRKLQGSGALVMPAAAAGINPANSGGAWTSGAYSQVLASTSEADWITGAVFTCDAASSGLVELEVDIATGGAGSETVISTVAAVHFDGNSGAAPMFLVPLPAPVAVATSTRVAVRMRSSSTTRVVKGLKLLYCKQSDLVAM